MHLALDSAPDEAGEWIIGDPQNIPSICLSIVVFLENGRCPHPTSVSKVGAHTPTHHDPTLGLSFDQARRRSPLLCTLPRKYELTG
jgi:hypothetical protein